MPRISLSPINRRSVLKGVGAFLALASSTALTSVAIAQPAAESRFAFDFESFSQRMQAMAAGPYRPLEVALPAVFGGLDYDAYRRIQFRPERGKFADLDAGYQIQAFHMGWLYKEPVRLFEVEAGTAAPFEFSAQDFQYHDSAIEAAVAAEPFPGVAGFHVNYPLNRPEALDELITFLGASYFRALGRDNIYGLSARGLVMNSWVEGPEEFPRFSEFYFEKPVAGQPITLYAALDSASVTGAYRFIITPASDSAQESVMEVTARLYFRADVKELGVAPLTSMFLFGDANRAAFDDYRPQVHDSNGLLVERADGEILWRALNNSSSLGNSYFTEHNPRAFGLYQRGRDFASYQDAGAHYERRPSARVEPIGDWGDGMIRLIEIPARLEAEDNIGAFWIPAEPVLAGQSREYSYRLIWGNLDPDPKADTAYVLETRAGQGGVSGVANAMTLRKFVVDFAGAALDGLPVDPPPDILSAVSGGVVRHSTVSRVEANGVWRLVLDVETDGVSPMELKAYLVGMGRKLTDTWLFQWRPGA